MVTGSYISLSRTKFLDMQISLVPTSVSRLVCLSLRLLAGRSHFHIFTLSASLDRHRASVETCDLSEWGGKKLVLQFDSARKLIGGYFIFPMCMGPNFFYSKFTRLAWLLSVARLFFVVAIFHICSQFSKESLNRQQAKFCIYQRTSADIFSFFKVGLSKLEHKS